VSADCGSREGRGFESRRLPSWKGLDKSNRGSSSPASSPPRPTKKLPVCAVYSWRTPSLIEDVISGVHVGRTGGFGLIIGVGLGDDPEVLRQNGADIVVRDLAELSLV
jgi:hypothetical protein